MVVMNMSHSWQLLASSPRTRLWSEHKNMALHNTTKHVNGGSNCGQYLEGPGVGRVGAAADLCPRHDGMLRFSSNQKVAKLVLSSGLYPSPRVPACRSRCELRIITTGSQTGERSRLSCSILPACQAPPSSLLEGPEQAHLFR